MSQENVEIVRAAIDAMNRGEAEPYLSAFHSSIVYHPRSDEPDPSAHIGRDAFEKLVRGFLESFSGLTIEVLELIDAGDRVIASTVLHLQVGDSGAGVNDAYVFVFELRDGLIVEGWEYKTKEEALAAAGLRD